MVSIFAARDLSDKSAEDKLFVVTPFVTVQPLVALKVALVIIDSSKRPAENAPEPIYFKVEGKVTVVIFEHS